MRINLAHGLSADKKKFIMHLVRMYAQEFDCGIQALFNHLKTGDQAVGEYFVSWLQQEGWQASWYSMPVPDKKYLDNYDPHGDWLMLSFGVIIEDSCDKLIAWKLANT